jgi:hypothetical protein
MLDHAFAVIVKLFLLVGFLVIVGYLAQESDKVIEGKKDSKTVIFLAYVYRTLFYCVGLLWLLSLYAGGIYIIYYIIKLFIDAIF